MKSLKIRVDVEGVLHDLKTIFKRHVQRTPHLLGDIAECSLSGVYLLLENLSPLVATTELVKEDMPGVLHEYRTIKVYQYQSANGLGSQLYSPRTREADDLSLRSHTRGVHPHE